MTYTRTVEETETAHVSICHIDDTLDLVKSDVQPRTDVNYRNYTSHMRHVRSDSSWVGGTMEQVTACLTTGWPEGVARVEELSRELAKDMPAPKSYRRKQQWRDEGDEPSWEREQAGYDNVWRTSRREQQRGPATIELLVPWGANAFATAESLQWNGVVLAVLADLLEAGGYRVGATLCGVLAIGGAWHVNQIVVKRPDMPLNLSALVPVVAHPGSFRWHGINMISLCPWNVGTGHGSVTPMDRLPKDLSIFHHNSIQLKECYYESAARAEILRVLALLA